MNKFVRYFFGLIVIFEGITAYLVSVGVWTQNFAWISLALAALFVLLAPPFEGLLLAVFSIPFYLAIPNHYSDSLSAWRLMLAWLFAVWFIKSAWAHYKAGNVWGFARQIRDNFFAWDKYLILFGLFATLSILLARFRAQSVKQILFLLNAFLIYVVVINVVKSRVQVYRLMKVMVASLGIIVFLGYVQFGASLFANQYYFWQYWAVMVSKSYYGVSLANVLIYSNSWFSYTGPNASLRMFSIMPDSHSFAVVCLFLLGILAAFLPNASRRKTILLWAGIALTCWALILSGTRGVWVGILGPAVIAAYMYLKSMGRPDAKRFLTIVFLVALFFVSSPVLVRGLNLIRSGLGGGDFLERVSSIYDLQEESNAGRLIIWKDSLKFAVRHPLGVGYGNFVVSLVPDISPTQTYDSVAAQKDLRYNLPQKFVTAHSLYLNVLVELGIIGLVIFVLIWLSYARQAWQFLKARGAANNELIAMAAQGSFILLWLLAYGVFDLTLFNDKVLIYSFVVLGLAGLIFRNHDIFINDPQNK